MHTFDAIRQRRAVKVYDPTHIISREEEDQLIDLAMQTPSSFNIQHWRIVRVTDPALRKQIRALGNDQSQMTDASLLYVITADVKAWTKKPERYFANAPKPVQDMLLPWMHAFYDGKEQLQRDEAMRSVGFIGQTLMLAAKAMGYDSCPMIGFDIDAVGKLINLPDDHAIGMMLAIGKGIKPPAPKNGYIDKADMLIDNRF